MSNQIYSNATTKYILTNIPEDRYDLGGADLSFARNTDVVMKFLNNSKNEIHGATHETISGLFTLAPGKYIIHLQTASEALAPALTENYGAWIQPSVTGVDERNIISQDTVFSYSAAKAVVININSLIDTNDTTTFGIWYRVNAGAGANMNLYGTTQNINPICYLSIFQLEKY